MNACVSYFAHAKSAGCIPSNPLLHGQADKRDVDWKLNVWAQLKSRRLQRQVPFKSKNVWSSVLEHEVNRKYEWRDGKCNSATKETSEMQKVWVALRKKGGVYPIQQTNIHLFTQLSMHLPNLPSTHPSIQLSIHPSINYWFLLSVICVSSDPPTIYPSFINPHIHWHSHFYHLSTHSLNYPTIHPSICPSIINSFMQWSIHCIFHPSMMNHPSIQIPILASIRSFTQLFIHLNTCSSIYPNSIPPFLPPST